MGIGDDVYWLIVLGYFSVALVSIANFTQRQQIHQAVYRNYIRHIYCQYSIKDFGDVRFMRYTHVRTCTYLLAEIFLVLDSSWR